MLFCIETHITSDFPGGGVRTPFPPSGSAHGSELNILAQISHLAVWGLPCNSHVNYGTLE